MQIAVTDAAVRIGSREVFSGVTARFPSGQVTALVGPSGSGKSTLLAVMAGFQELTEGTVIVQEDHDDGRATAPNARWIAWVPQTLTALGRRTVLDNAMLGALGSGLPFERARDAAREGLELVGLASRVEDHALALSGGELQRLTIARAIASQKPIIFADEPTANLDAANARNVAQVLGDLSIDRTVVVATHDPAIVRAAGHRVDLRSE